MRRIVLFFIGIGIFIISNSVFAQYDPSNSAKYPPTNLGKGSRTFEEIFFEIGTSTKARLVFSDTPVTGSGTTGRLGTSTGKAQLEYDYNGGTPTVNFKGFTGGVKINDVEVLDIEGFLSEWRADNKTGTGSVRFVAGEGVNLVSTYDPATGLGTITIYAAGTQTAGGWTDTGTQSVANENYQVVVQGNLVLDPAASVTGLDDDDIPSTIVLDNITQITSRSLQDMTGTLQLGTQSNKSVVMPDIQVGSSTVGTDSAKINFNSAAFEGTYNAGSDQTTIDLKAELKGTTSASAGYTVKLNGSGTVAAAQLDLPAIGSYVAKNVDTTYQATTDGFVIATISADNSGDRGYIHCYADANSNPTTIITVASANYNATGGNETWVPYGSLCVPVKAGNYYKIIQINTNGVCPVTVYWAPLE